MPNCLVEFFGLYRLTSLNRKYNIFKDNKAGVYGDVLFSLNGTLILRHFSIVIIIIALASRLIQRIQTRSYNTFSRYPNYLFMNFADQSVLQETPILVLDNITYYTFRSMYFEVSLTYNTGTEYHPSSGSFKLNFAHIHISAKLF